MLSKMLENFSKKPSSEKMSSTAKIYKCMEESLKELENKVREEEINSNLDVREAIENGNTSRAEASIENQIHVRSRDLYHEWTTLIKGPYDPNAMNCKYELNDEEIQNVSNCKK